MPVDDLDSLPNHDVPKDGKEGEDGGEGGLAIDDEEGDMVDLQAIGEIAHAGSPFICVGNDDDFVTTIDKFLQSVRTRRVVEGTPLTLPS